MTNIVSLRELRSQRTLPVYERLNKKYNAGQSLVEIMVVVFIIALIASIVIPNLAHARSNSTVSVSVANMKAIGSAGEVYFADHQAYPVSGNVTNTLFGPKYLPSTPNSPGPGGGQYAYAADATNNTYTLTDPATYDSLSLSNLPQSAAPSGGDVAPSTGKCGDAGCSHIGYSNAGGSFGY